MRKTFYLRPWLNRSARLLGRWNYIELFHLMGFLRFKLINNVFLDFLCIRISIFYISELLGDLWPWSDGRVGLYWSTSVVGTPGKAHFERRIDVWRPISSCRPYGKSELKLETVQDFLIKLGIKPLIHLLEINIFSLNIDIVRLVRNLKKQT